MTHQQETLIPYKTQFVKSQPTHDAALALFVYTPNMTETSVDLMKQCQIIFERFSRIEVCSDESLSTNHSSGDFYIIPYFKDDLVRKIRAIFDKARIFTTRAVIESQHRRVQLPNTYLGISLAMYNCHVFLTQSCNDQSLKSKIKVMCGNIVQKFDDDKLNVVITDRGDRRYCSKAYKRKVPCVTRDWIEECYTNSLSDDQEYFNLDAERKSSEHIIRPFTNCIFKINVPNSGEIKKLISSNQGKIIYGNDQSVTHIVVPKMDPSQQQTNMVVKKVDLDFIQTCSNFGYYLTMDDYKEYNKKREETTQVHVKQEVISQVPFPRGQSQKKQRTQENNRLSAQQTRPPPVSANGCHRSRDSQAMLPPPQTLRQVKQPTDPINDGAIKNAMNGLVYGTQTQMPSTQMGPVPDRQIHFESSVEPSQQLYWG